MSSDEVWSAGEFRRELSISLGRDAGEAASPTRLRFEGEALCFDCAGRRWRKIPGVAGLVDLGAAWAGLAAPDDSASLILRGHDLWLEDAAGDLYPLTSDGAPDFGYGDFSDFTSQVSGRGGRDRPVALWSPDSSRAATLRIDRRALRQAYLVQSVPAAGAAPQIHCYPFPVAGDSKVAGLELFFVSREGAPVRATIEGLELTAFEPFMLGRAWWSNDGARFYFVDCRRDGRSLALWSIDPRTGEARRLLVEEGAGVMLPAPTFVEPAICHRLQDGRLIWWSQRDGWGHLYLIDPEQPDAARQITCGNWLVRGLLHVDEDEGVLLFCASGREPGDPYLRRIYRVRLDGSDLRLLTPEDVDHDPTPQFNPLAGALLAGSVGYGGEACGTAPDGQCFVDNMASLSAPLRAVLRDRTGSILMELGAASLEASWPSALPLPEPFLIPARDGATTLRGVLYRPVGFDPERRYPLIDVVYGGPQKTAAPTSLRQTVVSAFAEQMAALGFAAMILDGPGTPYRSHAFQLATRGQIQSCGGLADHVAVIGELGARHAWIDTGRIGVMGASGGGYATVRAMGAHPDVYRVGVSFCGNHDQRAYVAMWGELYHGDFTPEAYEAQANQTIAAAITGRLLLVHGDMDDNVHPAHTLKVVDALIAADRDFDMLIVPNATHMVMLHPYAMKRAWKHFLTHLAESREPV